ncbi:MAG: DUF1553 domain-containing protein, partial [Planctomycetes bacterium]|nr:DUF1553 domain-containing protein [Planctomycetota bacterium]
LAYIPHTNRADKVSVRIFHREGDDTVFVNQRLVPPIDSRFISLGRYRFTKGNQWFVMLSTDGANGHVVADAVQFLPEALADKEAPKPKDERGKPLGSVNLADLEARLKTLEKKAPERPIAMAVADADKIIDMHVCVRGIVHNKGETAPRGFLQVATPQGANALRLAKNESGRRELAAWIASADNPLTARVYVNRVWHHLFGAGLVRTVDNFGATGETPSHPELLDYLAAKFTGEPSPVRGRSAGFGWSTKKLIREIVLSHAFQMASEPNADGVQADPENRLLWRMNRQRLEAEAIRDTILMVSGQLDRATMGNTMKKGTVAERDYVFDDFFPARRSVYTPIFRNRLHELFEVFDFPDPNMVLGKRNVSTVPTQALFMMNSPFIMKQARNAATLTLTLEIKDAERIDFAYRKTLGRSPTLRERELALAYVSAGQREAAWERFYQTLFACVDFRYVN